jgi:hypothetical protein
MRFGLVALAISLSVAGQSFADFKVLYSGKSVSFPGAVCRMERNCDGTASRFRILVGDEASTQEERLEVVLPQIGEINLKKTGELVMNNPDTDGNICLRTFDDARSTPKHRAFCLARIKGADSCNLNYTRDNDTLKVSFSCHLMRRASNPGLHELVDFEVPASNPIECQIIDAGIPSYCE